MTLYGLLKLLKAVPWRFWALLAFLAAVIGAQLYLRHKWVNEGRAQVLAEQADDRAKAAEDALRQAQANQAKAERLAQDFVDLAAGFLKDKQDAKAKGDVVAAELRASNLRLRKQWTACLSPSPAPGAGGADDAADLRQADIGRVYGIAAACTAHVSRLQDILRLER